MNLTAPSFRRALRRLLLALLLALLALGGAAFLGLRYLGTLRDVINDESYTYLHEISTQLTGNVENLISSTQSKTETLRDIICEMEWQDEAQLEAWLEKRRPLQQFSKIYLLDDDGCWFADGRKSGQSLMAGFSADVVYHGLVRMSGAQKIGGMDVLVLGVPMRLDTASGRRLRGLVAALELDSVREQLSLGVFNGMGYAHVITQDGRAVVRTDHPLSAFNGYSVFSALGNAEFLDGGSVDAVRRQLAEGHSAQCHYRFGVSERLATFVPIGIEDWYLACVLPTDFVHEKSELFIRLTMAACVAIGLIFLALVFIILSVQARGKRRLMLAAYVDPITGGNTQLRFLELARASLAAGRTPFALLYINIVDFKAYNDRLGRPGADGLLRCIRQTIEEALEPGECMGRLMADHFGVLLCEGELSAILTRLDEWNHIARGYAASVSGPTALQLTYGIYFVEDPRAELLQMLDRANLARKSIRPASGGNDLLYAVYDEALQGRLLYAKELADRFDFALEHGEFALYLQPKFHPEGGRPAGAEALVRWQHPARGLIPPVDFIPLCEDNGSIERLDLYMFRRACEWISRIIAAGVTPIPVSVNLSRCHFRRPGFLADFRTVWNDFRFDPTLIEFEFTEGMFEGQMDEFMGVIDQLHAAGFRCSMDDFGSGYSSLNMLSRLRLDVIKLDRQFFPRSGGIDPRTEITISSVIRLVKQLNMEVVAEGVEQRPQVDMLRSFGCDLIQGYVFSRPVPADELYELLLKAKEEGVLCAHCEEG